MTVPPRRPSSRQVKRWLMRHGRRLPSEPRQHSLLRWQDAVALLAIPLSIAGWKGEDTTFVALCLFLSAAVVLVPIVTTRSITPFFKLIMAILLFSVFASLTIYVRYKNIEHSLLSNEGTLEPNDKPTPTFPGQCRPPANAYVFLFGTNVDWTTHQPHAAITIGNQLLAIIIRADGKANIKYLRIFDDRDDLIARIENNQLWVNPTSRLERPDESTLTVFDHLDREVLHIELLNKKTIKLRGIFRYPGTRPIIITDALADIRGMVMTGSCAGEARGQGFIIN